MTIIASDTETRLYDGLKFEPSRQLIQTIKVIEGKIMPHMSVRSDSKSSDQTVIIYIILKNCQKWHKTKSPTNYLLYVHWFVAALIDHFNWQRMLWISVVPNWIGWHCHVGTNRSRFRLLPTIFEYISYTWICLIRSVEFNPNHRIYPISITIVSHLCGCKTLLMAFFTKAMLTKSIVRNGAWWSMMVKILILIIK